MLSTTTQPNPLLLEPKKTPFIPNTSIINEASSEGGHGVVNIPQRNLYFDKLQKNAATGVKFSVQFLLKTCFGGTCSAQSLNFADTFFNAPVEKKELADRFFWVTEQCKKSSLELRTQQAALNAITKDPEIEVKDFERAKVESIVALRDFDVVYASSPLKNDNGKIEFEDFAQEIKKLPEGLYFTRLLCKTNNHKLESFGHSVIFLNSSKGCYFWDPSCASYQLADHEVVKELYDRIGGTSSRWGLEAPRFYKIIPKNKPVDEKAESIKTSVFDFIEKTVFGWTS